MPHFYKTDYYKKAVARKRAWSGLHQINILMENRDERGGKNEGESMENIAVLDSDSDTCINRVIDSAAGERDTCEVDGGTCGGRGCNLDVFW